MTMRSSHRRVAAIGSSMGGESVMAGTSAGGAAHCRRVPPRAVHCAGTGQRRCWKSRHVNPLQATGGWRIACRRRWAWNGRTTQEDTHDCNFPWLPDALWSGTFFDGRWQAAVQRQPVIEPATGRALGEIGLADPAQVARSAAAAAQAQQAWAAAPMSSAHRCCAPPRGWPRRISTPWLNGWSRKRIDPPEGRLRGQGDRQGAARGRRIAVAQCRRDPALRTRPAEPGAASPAGRGRRHFTVQFSAVSGDARGGPGDRAGQCGGAQAGPTHGGMWWRGDCPPVRAGRLARGRPARAAG